MEQLINLLAEHGLPAYLRYTRSLAALIDARGVLLEWNPSFGQLLQNLPPAALLADLLTPAGKPVLAGMLANGAPARGTLPFLYDDGRLALECLAMPLPDGRLLFFAELGSAELNDLQGQVVSLKRALEIKKIELAAVLVQSREVSHTDALTFLPNRRQIVADLQREVMACDRYGKPLTIFMIDLDNFKRVNDTHGHQAGDQVLRELSLVMARAVRHLDKLGRYGGEEFLCLLPATGVKASLKLADRLLETARGLDVDLDGGSSAHVTISIGIAQYRRGRETWDELLRRADRALYHSKTNGRNQWTIANFSDGAVIASRSPRQE